MYFINEMQPIHTVHIPISRLLYCTVYTGGEREEIISPKVVAIILKNKQNTQGQTLLQYIKVAGLGTKLQKFHFSLCRKKQKRAKPFS